MSLNLLFRDAVGYTTQAIEANKWYLLGTQFEGVGSSNGTINLQDFVKSEQLVPTDDGLEGYSAEIQTWDYSAGGGKGGYKTFWYLTRGRCQGVWYNNVWTEVKGAYDKDFCLKAGEAVWLKSPVAATITVAGQIAQVGRTINIKKGVWNFIANPYPTEFVINGGKVNWVTTLGESTVADGEDDKAIEIQTWDLTAGGGKGGYKTFWYLQRGRSEGVWHNNVFTEVKGAYDPKASVAVGAGFWYKDPLANADYTIKFDL